MPRDPFLDGYYAALSMEGSCPYAIWSVDWWFWHSGNYFGHQTLSSQHDAIFLAFPQD